MTAELLVIPPIDWSDVSVVELCPIQKSFGLMEVGWAWKD
jgi:hypothetical protein